MAVKCDHDDEGDLIGTIYFNGPNKHRLDTVNSEGVPVHILADGGEAYIWTDGGEASQFLEAKKFGPMKMSKALGPPV